MEKASVIKPLVDTNISDKVFVVLKTAIHCGELQPGDPLIERDLAEKLAVSRTPVREAIQRLKTMGLAVQVSRKMVIVAKPTSEEVINTFDVREVLEGLAASRAATNATSEDLIYLENLAEEMEQCIAINDDDKLEELHMLFHERLYRASGNKKLYQLLMDLRDCIKAYTHIGYAFPGRKSEASQEHKRILEALISKNSRKAEEWARKHIKRSKEAYIRELQKESQI